MMITLFFFSEQIPYSSETVSAPSFSSYLPVLIPSSNKHNTSHYCIAFHLLGMCEFPLWLGVLRSFILSHILVLPKIKGMSGAVSAVFTCAALITQFRCKGPQLPCAVKLCVMSWGLAVDLAYPRWHGCAAIKTQAGWMFWIQPRLLKLHLKIQGEIILSANMNFVKLCRTQCIFIALHFQPDCKS